MNRIVKPVAMAVAATIVLAASAVAWYAFSEPPVHRLQLAPELTDVTTSQGQQLLATATAKTDYEELVPYFVSQERRAFCGVASGTTVMNAALQPRPPITQATFFTPEASAVRGEIAVTFGGMTLSQLADIIRAHGLKVEIVHAADSNLEAFRTAAIATLAEPSTFLIVNFDRAVLKQEGAGHISPVGAYNAATDRLLVLDVAAQKYPHTWVPASILWNAMATVDADAGATRGYLLVSAGPPPG